VHSCRKTIFYCWPDFSTDSSDFYPRETGFLPQLCACTPALEFRRADTSRAFSGGRHIAQFRMAYVAFVVVLVVLQALNLNVRYPACGFFEPRTLTLSVVVSRVNRGSSVGNPTKIDQLECRSTVGRSLTPRFVSYIFAVVQTSIWSFIMATAVGRQLEPLPSVLLRLRQLESDLKHILPTTDETLRDRLTKALSFIEKAEQVIQESLKEPTSEPQSVPQSIPRPPTFFGRQ
jgi:hypothetical protein